MHLLSQLRRRDAAPGLVLAIICAGVVLGSLDLFIVNVALPSIGRDLHARSLSDLSWILDAYAIVYASLLVLFGRLSEGRSRDLGFLVGVLVFTVASAACGAASSLLMLIIFRIIQATGAALLTPTSLSVVLATAPAERRQSSVRAWTALGGLAAALGPVAGGLLVALSWRWVFLVNVPIGVAALLVGWRRLPSVPGHPVPRPDLVGAALVTAGVAGLTLGLVQGNDWGWSSVGVVASLAGGVVLVIAFGLRLWQGTNPLIDPALFRVRTFSGASLVSLTFMIAFGAMLLSLVLWMQEVWGYSALRTGLSIAPGPLLVPVFAFGVAGRLIERFGPGRVIALGGIVYSLGAIWWTLRAGLHPNYPGEVLPGTMLTGAGVGLTLPTFMAAGTSSLPPASFATGSAVINMLRQVGLAIGVAILIAIIGTPHDPHAALDVFRRGWEAVAVAALMAALAGATVLHQARSRSIAPAETTEAA
ncbi:MAG: MFS transporter [Solirubrobacterales bacterium]|nr:MFS transporter [Solirubrobacterales bacterium]